MTPTLQTYPAYKSSCVEWLGDVPAHWEVRRIKTLFRELDERSGNGHGELLSLSRSKGLVPHGEASNRIASVDDLSNYKVCHPGALVMNRMQAWSGMFAVASQVGLISPDYCVFEAVDSCEVKYFEHLFKTPLVVGQFAQKSKGVGSGFNRLYTDDFGSVPIAAPPLPEQRAIVRYLDYIDRHVRRYVTAKRRLIALLEEEKQAIVNRAVTRGLDSNVRLKPSGVDWLGDVPEHWDIPRLRNLGDALIGLTYDPQDVVDEETGILVLRASNIFDGQLVYGDNVFVRSTVPEKLVTREGDILICSRSGSRALIGKNARINAESAGTTFGAFMTVFRGANNDFLHLVFNSKFFEYQSAAFFTSTINQLTLGILYGMKVPFPPLEERQSILRYVEETTAPITKAIAAARRKIELLQEYRTRLIADAVTGKLDVRAAAAQLPDEADESLGEELATEEEVTA